MSLFSGKCDLADHIMMEKLRTKEGSDKKEDLEKASVYYSDEMECFKIFKEKTGGVIHQHKKIKVTEFNQDLVAKKCSNFQVVKLIEQIPDKRSKTGIREKVTYSYKYWGKEYKNLKELNKHGVYITIDIHFDTLLDIIPYYPYIVSVCLSDENGEYIVLSSESFAIEERDDLLNGGFDSNLWEYYNKCLQNHYRDVILRYFNPVGREHTELLKFDENRQSKTSKPIDDNFDVKWAFYTKDAKSHWTEPKIIDYDKGIIEMSEPDYNQYLGNEMMVEYVEKQEYQLFLE